MSINLKKIILFFIVFLFNITVHGQTRTIRGIVYDKQTRERIKGVTITPDFFDNDSTVDKGRFKVFLPKKYKDTIRFSHPDYYPYITKINNAKPISINLIPQSIPLDTIFYNVFEGNATLTGMVYDFSNRDRLDSITLSIEGNKRVGFTDKTGEFSFSLPMTTRKIIASGDNYRSDTFQLSKFDFTTDLSIFLHPAHLKLNTKKSENYYSNIILCALNESLNKALGIRYIRFINNMFAIGLHGTYYFYGQRSVPFDYNTYFKGGKISGIFRFYFKRNMSNQSFLESKITGGYFDFNQLGYSREGYGEDYITLPVNFNSYGLGINWGYEDVMRNSNGIFGFSIGFQFFPMLIETTYVDEHNVTWKTDTWWWYTYGPGSIVEIKFYLGGIF